MLRTERTIIRPYKENDIERIRPILSDQETMSFWPKPFTQEQVEGWVRRNIQAHQETGFGRMIVELQETGQVAGDCGIVQARINGNLENDLGYIIHSPLWRKGLATECATALFDFGKQHGLKRIIANMPYNHIGSQRVAENLGMIQEQQFYNPRNRDILTYLYVWEG